MSPKDTLVNRPNSDYMANPGYETEGVVRFYDSLETKSHRNPVTGFLYDVLIQRPEQDTTVYGRMVDEAKGLRKYAGKTVGNITIERLDVFEKAHSVVQKGANGIHVITTENTIRRDLLLKEGDIIDPRQIVRNNQLLRSRRHISDMWMELYPREDDSTIVDIKFITRDKWSIAANLKLSSGERARVDLYDVNFIGTGTRFGVQTSYDWSGNQYGGNMLTYSAPNILGTFLSTDVLIGRRFEESRIDLELRKDFYLPTDFEFGAAYNDDELEFYELYLDEEIMTSVRSFDGWAGISKQLGTSRSSVFMTSRYSIADFDDRPEVGPRFNPRFHDYEMVLASLGLYKEKFYAANMIYGFGYKEYLPAGYRTEIIFGHNWGEFHDDDYLGFHARGGIYTGIGYLQGDVSAGTYMEQGTGDWWQSTAGANARWISNLFVMGVRGGTRMRQFITTNYTRGWNRAEGNNEYITFTRRSGPRSIREHIVGDHRFVVNTETVIFTPWQPMGFRIAFFGYGDAGWLGFEPDLFSNDFYASFGLGIRVRNERFIFNTLQLRVGLAVGKNGPIDNRRFQLSTEQRMEQFRFIPTRPSVLDFTETQLLQ